MRRKDREVTDPDKIREIILNCHCCRLGFYDAGEVYIVPLNFGYEENAGKRTFYFHSAKDGRKIDLLSRNSAAGFELDTNYSLLEGRIACEYAARFQSVIGTGEVTILKELQDKKDALKAIMLHNTGTEDWEFSEAMLNAACVFKMEVKKLSCKEHL